MRAFDINGEKIREGIPVSLEPYPRVVLGDGGHKRATWIALGKSDAGIIELKRLPCPEQGCERYFFKEVSDPVCERCGEKYIPRHYPAGENGRYELHPNSGQINGSSCVLSAGVLRIKDAEGKPTGKYLIVAPRDGSDNRILVLWRVPSGFRGSASITPGEGVIVIAKDSAWHSGRGATGETAEILAVLSPGQELKASRSGRRVEATQAKLVWDGQNITVTFGDNNMEAALAEKVEGELL